MKKKIKLRDLTKEQWDKNRNSLCKLISHGCCENCIFQWAGGCSDSIYKSSWINHKDFYSNKFLDQEIEIEVENENILTKEEKEYLSAVIKPFRDRIISIEKHEQDLYYQTIIIQLTSKFPNKDFEFIRLPWFNEAKKMYKNMEARKKYDLEELGL